MSEEDASRVIDGLVEQVRWERAARHLAEQRAAALQARLTVACGACGARAVTPRLSRESSMAADLVRSVLELDDEGDVPPLNPVCPDMEIMGHYHPFSCRCVKEGDT